MLNTKLVYLVLIVLCFAVYANTLQNQFIDVDDVPTIVKNPRIADVAYYCWNPPPLINSICFHIGRFNPFPYHVASVLLHCCATILVFVLLRLFFQKESSFVGAGLFAVHPIHTEAVAWISGKGHIFITIFVLAAYLLYYKASEQKNRSKINRAQYSISVVIFAYFMINNFSFCSLLPLLLIFSDVIFKRCRQNWKLWLPFIAITAIRLFWARGAFYARVVRDTADIAGLESVVNPIYYFLYSFISYLWLLIWPAKLTLYHEPNIFHAWILWSAAFVVVLAACCVPFLFKRAKSVLLGLVTFTLFLAPTYTPLPLASLVAERYVYLPSIFISILFAFLYQRLSRKPNGARRGLVIFLCLSLFVSYAVRTVVRNADWKNDTTLWKATIAVSPMSPRAHSNMGVAYFHDGKLKQAIKELEKAIELHPNYYAAYNNLGALYKKIGRTDLALPLFQMATQKGATRAEAYYNLGVAHGEFKQTEQAIEAYRKAIELNPDYVNAHNNLALSYEVFQRYDEAQQHYRRAIEIDPSHSKAYMNLGHVCIILGEKEEAQKNLLKAKELSQQQNDQRLIKKVEEYLQQLN
ncbi:tetratricopeptide repeat protein [Candidatus Omnitrophota bacterium]